MGKNKQDSKPPAAKSGKGKSGKGGGKGGGGDDSTDTKSSGKLKGGQSINVRHILVRYSLSLSETENADDAESGILTPYLYKKSVRNSPRAKRPLRGCATATSSMLWLGRCRRIRPIRVRYARLMLAG
jgi:hypothetical protein